MSMRPCAIIFREQPTDPWVDFDYLLLETYQRMQDDVCKQCGHPRYLCRYDGNEFRWVVKTEVCYATQALRASEDKKLPADKRAKTAEKAEWGLSKYVIPKAYDGYEIPSRTEALKA